MMFRPFGETFFLSKSCLLVSVIITTTPLIINMLVCTSIIADLYPVSEKKYFYCVVNYLMNEQTLI